MEVQGGKPPGAEAPPGPAPVSAFRKHPVSGGEEAVPLQNEAHGVKARFAHQVPPGPAFVLGGLDAVVVAEEEAAVGKPQEGVDVPGGHLAHGDLGQGAQGQRHA